jgi:hypothetical protein
MKHPDDDTLLKSALGLLDEQEEAALQSHISQCDDCRERINRIKNDTDVIGSLELDIGTPEIPLPTPHHIAYMSLLKAVALILVGFAVGYGTSTLSHRESVNVIPQQLQTSSPVGTAVQYSSCEPVDLNISHTPIIPDTSAT